MMVSSEYNGKDSRKMICHCSQNFQLYDRQFKSFLSLFAGVILLILEFTKISFTLLPHHKLTSPKHEHQNMSVDNFGN